MEVLSERIGTPLTLPDVGLDTSGVEKVRWNGPLMPIQTATELITYAKGDLMLASSQINVVGFLERCDPPFGVSAAAGAEAVTYSHLQVVLC